MKHSSLLRSVLCLAMLPALDGCVLQAPPTHGELTKEAFGSAMTLPENWVATESSGAVATGWLEDFGDARLDALVGEAIVHNADLRVAAARMEQSAAAVRIAGGSLYPAVNLLGRRGTKDGDASEPLNIGLLSVSWELDVWGRVRYGARAAEDTYAATAADYSYARQSIAALVVRSWLLASEAVLQRTLAAEALLAAENLQVIAEDRSRVGVGSELEVTLARASVANYRDTLRQLDLSKEQAVRALELLLGRYPAAELPIDPIFPNVSKDVQAGLPSELLERRPDVAAAERRVAAAFNLRGQARAARLPQLSLRAGLSYLDSDVLVLKERDDPRFGTSGSLLFPLFAGGALKAQVDLRTAEQRAAVAQYANAGLKAFGEVENALAAERAARDRSSLLESQARDNERALVLENIRFRVGNTDLRSVTQQQVAVYAARSALLRARAERLTQRVNLYLALGGGFEKVL